MVTSRVQVSGIDYLIEVKNSLLESLPSNWVKISATKTVSRFHTPYILDQVCEHSKTHIITRHHTQCISTLAVRVC